MAGIEGHDAPGRQVVLRENARGRWIGGSRRRSQQGDDAQCKLNRQQVDDGRAVIGSWAETPE